MVRGLAAMVSLALMLFSGASAKAETVIVKYRGGVELAPFECQDITRSSFIRRICYDADNQYMLISLNGTYYHYCAVGSVVLGALLNAPSIGKLYNSRIRGSGSDGPFDCRTHRVPEY